MTGSVEPLVSVIVPTRDRPESLARCLESILLSQPHRYEIIVIDQSEAAGGARALDEFGPAATFVRWERPPLTGRSAAINHAVAIARAPLIATVDDDTTVGAGWLERGVAAFDARPEAAAVLGPLLAGRRPERDELLTTFRRTRPAVWRGRLPPGTAPRRWRERLVPTRDVRTRRAVRPGSRPGWKVRCRRGCGLCNQDPPGGADRGV